MTVSFRGLAWLSLVMVVACVRPNEESTNGPSGFTPAAGGKNYGGVFRLNESEYIKSLHPHSITDAFTYRTASQIYEGLFAFDPTTLQVVPRLVEGYDLSPDGTSYTFRLKKGVYFQDDPCFPNGEGRELEAKDVAYCFGMLCTQRRQNQNFSLFQGIIQGASEYYAASAEGQAPTGGVSGIQVEDKHTLRIQLTEPNSLFLMYLAQPACFIYAPEAEVAYGEGMRNRAVGTGPFFLASIDEDIAIILRKNLDYHRKDAEGNTLPFLEGIHIQFVKDKKTELLEFRQHNFDMVYRLPTDYIMEILAGTAEDAEDGEYSEYQLQRVPEMVTQFLFFNTQNEVFDDVDVRKAFNFAVDRQKILNYVLNGEGFAAGNHGITPPVFPDYDTEKVRGYSLQKDSAQYYLEKAGYPAGEGFPEISLILNADGERNTQVAVELQKQFLDHLNVNVEIKVYPLAQLLEKGFYGDFNLMRAGWYADYPSAENFLWLFSGESVPKTQDQPSYPNVARWKNEKYDWLYQEAIRARSIEEANELFLEAEQILMDEAPLLVLWYDEGYRLLQPQVRDFPNNPMQYRDLALVWFDYSL
ncbi:MAG TPA: ABC transporter substrate-binding protein [Cytophagales bacterium]|nr:ABC transporter substrate-binding protein [Cytophagales bacterium]HAA20183.1 ABC transporter substrate-binding protein [Cytophagales bacterium]HAP58929.1 ABC transporter substrate-binding protein [Cytophagales bacterium]